MHRPTRMPLSERDLALLSLLAEHRLALPTHAAALLGVSVKTAGTRLNKLGEDGFVRVQDPFPGEPRWYRITRKGLATIGSGLPPPRIDLRAYRHDVGAAWLWLAARGGTFGPLSDIIAERRLRSEDGGREPGAEPLGVRLGGFGPGGAPRLHYPDLMLRTADGRQIALELELSSKGRARLETILSGYGSDPRIDGVVYFVDKASVARSVTEAARRLGVSARVRIQRVRLAGATPPARRARTIDRAEPGLAL